MLSGMNMQHHMESLRERVRACRVTRAELSAACGGVVSPSWLSKFAAGRMKNPSVKSLMAVEIALNSAAAKRDAG